MNKFGLKFPKKDFEAFKELMSVCVELKDSEKTKFLKAEKIVVEKE